MIQDGPREPGHFVKVATVGDISAGNVLAARLRAEGIEVRVHSPSFGPYPMTVGDLADAEIWVMSDRVEEASSILLDAEVNDAIGAADPDITNVERKHDYERRLIALVVGSLVAVFTDPDVPLWLRLALGAATAGVTFLTVSATAERWRARRSERYEGIER